MIFDAAFYQELANELRAKEPVLASVAVLEPVEINVPEPEPEESSFRLFQYVKQQFLENELNTVLSKFNVILPDSTKAGFTFSLPRRGYAIDVSVASPEFITASLSKKKSSSPILNGNGSIDTIAFADFDTLPIGFKNWDHLESVLTPAFKNRGIILRSHSNKVKIAFKLKGIWCIDEAKEFLSKELSILNLWSSKSPVKNDIGETILKECIDKTHSGIFKCACNLDIIERLQKDWVFVETFKKETKKHKTAEAISDIENTTTEINTSYIHTWNFFKGALPNEYKLGNIQEGVIRLMLGWANKAISGMDCPINYIAATLNTDTSSISKALKSLRESGFIEKISDAGERKMKQKRVWFTKAATYKLSEQLANFAQTLIKASKKATATVNSFINKSLDGCSHVLLFDLKYECNGDFELYQSCIQSHPEMEKKDRYKKALDIWHW